MERRNSLPLLSSLCAGRESLCYSYSWWRFFSLPKSNVKFFYFLLFPLFPYEGWGLPFPPIISLPEVKRESFACYFLQTLTVTFFCFNISVWELLSPPPQLFFSFTSVSAVFCPTKMWNHIKFGYWQLWSKYNCIHLVLLSTFKC